MDNLDLLAQAPHLVIDGTFSTSPNLITQMVTVHGLYPDGWSIPLTYGLLPGKTEAHYKKEQDLTDRNQDLFRTTVHVALQSR